MAGKSKENVSQGCLDANRLYLLVLTFNSKNGTKIMNMAVHVWVQLFIKVIIWFL